MTNDEIIAEVKALAKESNACGFAIDQGIAKCRGADNDYTPCCTGCKFLGAKGCTTRSDACSFYFCPSAWNHMRLEIRQRITELAAMYTGTLRFRGDGHVMQSKPPFLW